MPAPLVWAGIALVAGAGLVADQLWGDDESREALENAGVNGPDEIDLNDPQVIEALEQMDEETQQRAIAMVQQQVQQRQAAGGSTPSDAPAATGTTDLSGLSSELSPDDPQASGAEEPPEDAFTYEGHTFTEPPPAMGSPGQTDQDDDLAQAFMYGGLPTGPGQIDEQGRLLAGQIVPGDDATPPGHSPPSLVVPYLESLHRWASQAGHTAEGLYRQRYYRAESLRLTRELQQRRAQTRDSSSISTAEERLREFYDTEGSLTPWESHTSGMLDISEGSKGLHFSEQELTADPIVARRLADQLTSEPGEREPKNLERFEFAPFRGLADRDAASGGMSAAIEGFVAGLSQSGDFTEAELASIDAGMAMGDPNSTSLYVRRSHRRLPGGNYRPDTGSLAGIARTERALEEASVVQVGGQQVIDQLHRLSTPEVEKLQIALWKGGFYGDNVPMKGEVADGVTIPALQQAIDLAAGFARAGEIVTLEEVIERRQEQFEGRLGEMLGGGRSTGDVQVNLEDPAALRELVEQTAIQTIGAANLSDEQINQFVGMIHQGQREQAQARISRRNEALQEWNPETPWDEPPEELLAGQVVESTSVAPGARAEDFIEQQRPGEAGATDFANTYGSFLELIGGGGR